MYFTSAAVSVSAAVIAAERVHNVYWRGGEGGGEVPGPEGGVPGHRLPAVLLHPVQVQHGVPRVPGVLQWVKINWLYCTVEHIIRIKTEEKANVVAAVRETESIRFFAALATVLHPIHHIALVQFILIFKLFWCTTASAARNLINSAPLSSRDDLCLLCCLYPSSTL